MEQIRSLSGQAFIDTPLSAITAIELLISGNYQIFYRSYVSSAYLKLSELQTFGAYPFKVFDSQPRAKELTAFTKEQSIFAPATVLSEKDGPRWQYNWGANM